MNRPRMPEIVLLDPLGRRTPRSRDGRIALWRAPLGWTRVAKAVVSAGVTRLNGGSASPLRLPPLTACNPRPQERALRLARALERQGEVRPRHFEMPRIAVQLTEHRLPQVPMEHRLRWLRPREKRQGGLRAAKLRHRDGPIHHVERRRCQLFEHRVEIGNFTPPCRCEARGAAMLESNSDLGVPSRKALACGRALQPLAPARNQLLVPLRPVLFLEQEKSPFVVHA